MNAVMMPEVSAGSNQIGASEKCTAHVSCPSAPAARTGRTSTPARPRLAAAPPSKPRRVIVSPAMMYPPARSHRGFAPELPSHERCHDKAIAPANMPKEGTPLVWRFRSPHHSCSESEMRTSEPKPHQINKLLVSFDSEVRKRGCGTMMRTSESGH